MMDIGDNDRFRQVIERLSDGFGIQDEKGILTYVNERLCEILGFTKEE